MCSARSPAWARRRLQTRLAYSAALLLGYCLHVLTIQKMYNTSLSELPCKLKRIVLGCLKQRLSLYSKVLTKEPSAFSYSRTKSPECTSYNLKYLSAGKWVAALLQLRSLICQITNLEYYCPVHKHVGELKYGTLSSLEFHSTQLQSLGTSKTKDLTGPLR